MFLSCQSASTFKALTHACNILRGWFPREMRGPPLTLLLVPHFFLSSICTHWQSVVHINAVEFLEQEVLAAPEDAFELDSSWAAVHVLAFY